MSNLNLVVQDVRHLNVRRRNRNKKNRQTHLDENGFSLPMEIRPVIDVIMAYGKKTNSLGTLGAAKILTDIAESLKKLNLHSTNVAIKELIDNAEKQAENLRFQVEASYDET